MSWKQEKHIVMKMRKICLFLSEKFVFTYEHIHTFYNSTTHLQLSCAKNKLFENKLRNNFNQAHNTTEAVVVADDVRMMII